MLKKSIIAGAIAALVGVSGYFAVPAFAKGVPAPVEKHPVIHRSINQLDTVEKELAKADNDFGGHKEKARQLVRDAINELHLALKSDRH